MQDLQFVLNLVKDSQNLNLDFRVNGGYYKVKKSQSQKQEV